jgi:hypothetical protein
VSVTTTVESWVRVPGTEGVQHLLDALQTIMIRDFTVEYEPEALLPYLIKYRVSGREIQVVVD